MEFLTMEEYETGATDSVQVLLFTTPLCGTCQLAKEMVTLCMASLKVSLPTYECRVTDWQPYVQKWKIASVPCLLFERNGQILEKIYAIESVLKVYGLYQEYLRRS